MAKASELLARIDERQQALENNFETHQDYTKQMFVTLDEKLSKVLDQTTKTNGRVTLLEQWKAKLKGIWFAVVVITVTVNGLVILYFTVK